VDWLKMLGKGGLGILTFLAAQLIANTDMLVGLLPENIANLTVGGIVAGLIVAAANWLKHRAD